MSEVIERIDELGEATPMMAQYILVKNKYRDAILMYRLGDFYEMFFEDAVTASRVLELTLTGRDCGDDRRAAMCGVPFHKADVYIGRLVSRGFRVAVCEQMEDPSTAKGLVKRDVIRVVTPGTVTDTALLSDTQSNYLASVYLSGADTAVAFADISTGHVYATVCPEGTDWFTMLKNELAAYMPREAIINLAASECRELCDFLTMHCNAMLTASRADLFDGESTRRDVRTCFGESSGLPTSAAVCAVGALLAYIRQTQMVQPDFLRELHVYTSGQYLEMDANTLRNLELTETMRTKEKKGTLLWVLDYTCTSMGGRLLRTWIRKPLCDIAAISHRQSAVSELVSDFMCREELRSELSSVLDLERLTAKAVYGTANARDILAIARSLRPLPAVRERLKKANSPQLHRIYEAMDPLTELEALLSGALEEDPPYTVREGGMIRRGYNAETDRLRAICEHGNSFMKDIEARESAATGIKGLKVAYNKVFGYYIEVTKSQVSLVPETYIRKQTLTTAERYITQELKEMETSILTASDRLKALEYELFAELRDRVAAESAALQRTAAQIAALDIYLSFADVASKNNYVCPEVDMSDVTEITDGRHPVVEKFTEGGYFVPNNTSLSTGANRMMLITGPNMAGKSTYMRQVALIVLMAQIGSFVPAAKARVGITDRIFTRVGASDDLASGQSTFMLEMTEVAYILKHATRRSLIVFDEVGRGTSTYDGMSIARAVVEYTASKKIGARSMFATHYHELTDLEGQCDGVINYHVAAKKRGDDIVFLRKIVRGATDDSYGIEVAKLAGVPAEVVRRAHAVLEAVENGSCIDAVGSKTSKTSKSAKPANDGDDMLPDMLTQLRQKESDEMADRLRHADLNTLTPIEAMNLLFSLKKMLSDTSS